MAFIDLILDKIVPYDCLSCGQEGQLLCPACITALPPMPERCYRCHDFSPGNLTCPKCRETSALYRAQAATVYTDAAKDILWRLKSNGARSAAQIMAETMSRRLTLNGKWLIVPVPTSADRVRQRSYDQAYLIARDLSKVTRCPLLPCLFRSSKAHQVGADRQRRLKQLEGAFRVGKQALIKDRHIILVDDVITTGATLESAAETLRRAGAGPIEAIAFAQPLMRKKQ